MLPPVQCGQMTVYDHKNTNAQLSCSTSSKLMHYTRKKSCIYTSTFPFKIVHKRKSSACVSCHDRVVSCIVSRECSEYKKRRVKERKAMCYMYKIEPVNVL
ncbi:hypothetical protein BD410DRAFT_253124 [Rickenella mellea]|uniref:Uncharacterized protein n=1 Tax=Rickenella mellea TaxID=50990 RepID=A0A4Y7QNR1_9AGAM|nr:hypothetical protein BD410DRAFT_253124 [Rickenella mellea]